LRCKYTAIENISINKA